MAAAAEMCLGCVCVCVCCFFEVLSKMEPSRFSLPSTVNRATCIQDHSAPWLGYRVTVQNQHPASTTSASTTDRLNNLETQAQSSSKVAFVPLMGLFLKCTCGQKHTRHLHSNAAAWGSRAISAVWATCQAREDRPLQAGEPESVSQPSPHRHLPGEQGLQPRPLTVPAPGQAEAT